MKPVLFESDKMVFDNNGIGVLYDTHSASVYEEYNGIFDLSLTYPSNGQYANDLVEDRIILAKPNDVDPDHAFRIYEIDKDLDDDYIYVRATSITDDLAGNLIPHAMVENATPQVAMNTMKANLIEPTHFDFVSDIQVSSSTEWRLINPLQAIVGVDGSLVDIWGGDIKRTNNTVYLYSRRGRSKATVIRPGKNINGFNMTLSTKGLITKILPVFTYTPQPITEYEMVDQGDGTFVKQTKYSETYEPQEAITIHGDVVISQNANKYATNYYTVVDYSNDEMLIELINLFIQVREEEAELSETVIDNSGFDEDLRGFVTTILNAEAEDYFIYRNPGCDEPKVEIKADLVQLTDSEEWERYKALEQIQLTDTVDVYIKKFNIDVELSIKALTYDVLGERVTNITVGTARNTLAQQTERGYTDKVKELKDYITTLENGVYNTMTKAANGQVRRFGGYTEPPANLSSKGDLWFKEVGNGIVEMYTYNGVGWVGVVTGDELDNMQQLVDNAKDIAEYASDTAQELYDRLTDVVLDNGFTSFEDLIASKISSDDASTMFFQQANAIGLIYEKDGVNEGIIMLNNGMPYIKGEHIVLNGDTIVDGTFTVTEDMIGQNAIINHIKASGIDASEIRVINMDFDSITGGDIELTKGFRITNNGVPVLQVDAVTGQVRITAPNLASKDDIKDIGIGGRNLFVDTIYYSNTDFWTRKGPVGFEDGTFRGSAITRITNAWSNIVYKLDTLEGILADANYVVSVYVKADFDTSFEREAFVSRIVAYGFVNPHTLCNWSDLSSEWKRFHFTFKGSEILNSTDTTGFRFESIYNTPAGGGITFAGYMLERGTQPSDWSPAPEDMYIAIYGKAETSDLENLGSIVSEISADILGKASLGELEQLEKTFQSRMEQDIRDKKKLSDDLTTIEGRTTLIETIAGANKIVTEFIETVITESNEGIFISRGSKSTGILISTDRISFMDNGVEVAYISNKTMQINHGIFVESATIGGFKFERIPNTTILALTWVGE